MPRPKDYRNAAATKEMTTGSSKVNESIQSIAGISEETAAAAEEVTASTEEMTAATEEIAEASRILAKKVTELKENLSFFKVL